MSDSIQNLLDALERGQLTGADLAEAESMALLGLSLEPVTPESATFERLMKSVQSKSRFEAFTDTVAQIIDTAKDRAKMLLDGIDNLANWEPGPLEWIQLYHLDGGPATAGAIVGFIKLEPGTEFPPHTHLGEETVMVLQGSYRDVDGSVYRRGDVIKMAAGTSHHFVALEGPDLVYLAVIFDGIQIGDMVLRPGDPRI